MIVIDELRIKIGESALVTWGISAETPEILTEYIEGLVGQLRESNKKEWEARGFSPKPIENTILRELDPEYVKRLEAFTASYKDKRVWLEGDWNIPEEEELSNGWCCKAMANFADRIWCEGKKNKGGGFYRGYFFCGYRMVYCPFCGTEI